MQIRFYVNKKEVQIDTSPNRTLLDVRRSDLGLTGTKYGCGIGECGACTVIIDGQAKNACLVLIGQVNGKWVETVEGLADGEELHKLQDAFIKHHALQCGFCTPSMLMSAKALLDRKASPSEEGIKEAIAGNLCRCTGYQQIVDAIKEVIEDRKEG
ncbi:MAG: (2Fe-2S)-binding protein [Dehalobacterium sp.]